MRPRTSRSSARRLIAVVVAVAAAGLVLDAAALGQTTTPAGIVASDFAFSAAAGGAPNLTIATGGEVTFAYASGTSRHNVVFSGAQPAFCQVGVASGQVSGPQAPLPDQPHEAPWRGSCDFDRAGTYPFVCGLHPEMTGSITVVDPPGGPPPRRRTLLEALDIPAAASLRVARIQRGNGVRASLVVARAGSRLLARAFVRRSALAGGRSTREVEVGRRLLTPVQGRVTFDVALGAAARRALRRDGRLAIALRIAVTPPHGRSYAAARSIVLHRSST